MINFYFFSILLLLVCLGSTFASNLTVEFNKTDACNSKGSLQYGDFCEFQLIITVPPTESTTLYIELYSSNLTTVYTVMSEPSYVTGQNIRLANYTSPVTTKYSSQGSTYMDSAIIDFGLLINNGSSGLLNDNMVIVSFMVIIVGDGLSTGADIWTGSGISYDQDQRVWVGAVKSNYSASLNRNNAPVISTASNTISAELGSFGIIEFYYSNALFFYNMTLEITSSNTNLKICSCQVKNVNDYYKVFTNSDYFMTSLSSLNTPKAFSFGWIPKNIATSKYNVSVVLTYRVLPNASTTDSYTIRINSTQINITVTNPSVYSIAPEPDIDFYLNTISGSNTVNIYEPFFLTFDMDFPLSYDHYFKLNIESTSNDTTARFKACNIEVLYAGGNMPCADCLATDDAIVYSDSSTPTAYDKIYYEITRLKNAGIKTEADSLANKIKLRVILQLLDHPMNTPNTNTSVIATIEIGNQTKWVGLAYFVTANSSTVKNPSFDILYGDNKPSATLFYDTRVINFNIITRPKEVYFPLNIEILMPETTVGSNVLAATICKVEIYAGKYTKCVQPSFVNDLLNAQIVYESRMIRFKKDKALVKLPYLCNSDLNSTGTSDDYTIKLILYTQLDDITNTLENSISFATELANDTILAGHIPLQYNGTKTTSSKPFYIFPIPTLTHVYSGSRTTISYVLKVPVNSTKTFNISTILTSLLTQGRVSYCTYKITQQGNYVPCAGLISHSYSYDSQTFLKIAEKSYGGTVCSTNQLSTGYINSTTFDDDSFLIEILTLTSRDAVGTYRLQVTLVDGTNMYNGNTTWAVIGTTNPLKNFNESLMNSSFVIVNPYTDNDWFADYESYLHFTYYYPQLYETQTSIFRFNLTIVDQDPFDLKLVLTVLSPLYEFEIQKLFISNTGDNLPCTKTNLLNASFYNSSTTTIENATNTSYQAIIDVGDICYYSIDPLNISASTLTLEAHLRIPNQVDKVNNTNVTIDMNVLVNNQSSNVLSKRIYLLTEDELGYNNALFFNKNFSLNVSASSATNVTIRQSVNFTVSFMKPPGSNDWTTIRFYCFDQITQRQFCSIKSVKLISAGKNVDGMMKENQQGKIQPEFNFDLPTTTGYNVSSWIDLGIVTNTLYTLRMGQYDPLEDDKIVMQYELSIIDSIDTDHLASFTPLVIVQTNLRFFQISNFTTNTTNVTVPVNPITIYRTGLEVPDVVLNCTNLNSSSILSSSTKFEVNCQLYHTNLSLAEAYNVSVIYFLPLYVKFDSIVSTNYKRIFSNITNNATLTFWFESLVFDEVIDITFALTVNPTLNYDFYVQQYREIPSVINIPYIAKYSKIPRSISGSTPNNSNTRMRSINYVPAPASLANSSLLASLDDCQFSASAANSNAKNVRSTGWITGKKSVDWFNKNGYLYLTISLGNLTNVTGITLEQLAGYSNVSNIRISYSLDGKFYFVLDDFVFPPNNLTFEYLNSFECRYLRIHILSVSSFAPDNTATTGFKIKSLIGKILETNQTIKNICSTQRSISPLFSKQSALHISLKNTLKNLLFICEETISRVNCYRGKTDNTSSYSWISLPNTVSTVVFWVYDRENTKQFIYGIGQDKTTYVKSDDDGLTWKSVSTNEFITVRGTAVTYKNIRYNYNDYILVDLSSIYYLPTAFNGTATSWKVDNTSVSLGSISLYTWNI